MCKDIIINNLPKEPTCLFDLHNLFLHLNISIKDFATTIDELIKDKQVIHCSGNKFKKL